MSAECSTSLSSPSMPPNNDPGNLQQQRCCTTPVSTLGLNPPFTGQISDCLEKPFSSEPSCLPSSTSEACLVRISTPAQSVYPFGPSQQNVCAGCGYLIWERTLLSAVDRNWHNNCLKCYCCGGRLADLGSSFFLRSNMFLCRQDYLKLFGIAGTCNSCQSAIPPDELVMRCQALVYHVKCFNCARCHAPLLPGERYLLLNGSLFCEHEFTRLLPTADWRCGLGPPTQTQTDTTAAAGCLSPAAAATAADRHFAVNGTGKLTSSSRQMSPPRHMLGGPCPSLSLPSTPPSGACQQIRSPPLLNENNVPSSVAMPAVTTATATVYPGPSSLEVTVRPPPGGPLAAAPAAPSVGGAGAANVNRARQKYPASHLRNLVQQDVPSSWKSYPHILLTGCAVFGEALLL
ncbi:unnamed protein product [Schistocephalus solidus]|uniref:LIM zinc-binding domain-containing protein n=1 Tax=Schistocephalus solidus TaxID=70667 RepID=A0A183SGJ1_SCHSO|nr:unnamed protein product [Schistocephalus solidus]